MALVATHDEKSIDNIQEKVDWFNYINYYKLTVMAGLMIACNTMHYNSSLLDFMLRL